MCACGRLQVRKICGSLELWKKRSWICVRYCFDELFDGYLVEESMWGFRVSIGNRKCLILVYKEE